MNENEASRHELPIRFTASGSEYFRIWVVNLLFIVLTLGLYLPFAKARRLRYFYANTRIEGDSFAFHGDPWRMFRGYLLMLLLFVSYALSGHFSLWAGLALFVLLALMWPALWRSSQRFRLGNTSWRGLRFGFAGSLGGAYAAMLPWFIPGFVVVVANAWFLDGVDQSDGEAMKQAISAQGPWIAAAMVFMLLFFPLGLALLKRYQNNSYRFAQQRTQLATGVGRFYALALKVLGLLLACAVLAVALALLLRPLVFSAPLPMAMALTGFLAGFYLLFTLVFCGASFTAGLQNLVWGRTASAALRFDSRLGTGRMTRLQLKNLLLIALTLGLYRPFAVVNTMRLRLDSISVQRDGELRGWRPTGSEAGRTAAGEMSGDFFGFDIGL